MVNASVESRELEVCAIDPVSVFRDRSDDIEKLAAALAKAQAANMTAAENATNPHFKSSYADLKSCWDACREQLTSNGISITQPTFLGEDGQLFLRTVLMHSSGQYISGVMPIKPEKETPQSLGSCKTYVRRYALCAMVGIAPEDDDGNAASQPAQGRKRQTAKAKPKTQSKTKADADPWKTAVQYFKAEWNVPEDALMDYVEGEKDPLAYAKLVATKLKDGKTTVAEVFPKLFKQAAESE